MGFFDLKVQNGSAGILVCCDFFIPMVKNHSQVADSYLPFSCYLSPRFIIITNTRHWPETVQFCPHSHNPHKIFLTLYCVALIFNIFQFGNKQKYV